MVAVSSSDYQQFGCVECGCDFAYNNGIKFSGVVLLKCGECGKEFAILADGLTKSTMTFSTGKKDSNGEIIFSCPTLQEHPRKGIEKHKFIRPDIRPKYGNGEFCNPRGIRYDLACFVRSKEAGERVVKMFQNIQKEYKDERCFTCRLDYRENEPLRGQVKINYDNIGEHNASVLSQLIKEDGIITEDKIRKARNIEWDFANMWKYITANKILISVNLELIQKLVKYPNDITEDDKDSIMLDLENNKNLLAMFEIYGMYLQVNIELSSDNVERAVEVVEHTILNIDSQLYKDIQGKRKYADQRVFHEHLKEYLLELLQVHSKGMQPNGPVKKLKQKE